MELVFPLVFRQGIVYAVQLKGRAADAVCVPAHQRADIRAPFKIFPGRAVLQQKLAALQRNTCDRRPQSHHAHLQGTGIDEVFLLTAKVSFDNHTFSPPGKHNVQTEKKQAITRFFDIFLTLVNWIAL